MIYRKATNDDIINIIAMKNKVKQRIIEENLPIWLNGYPLDELIKEDIENNEGRVVGKGTHNELMKDCEVYKQIALSQLSKEELDNE